jgi:hypothetical protein
MVAINFSPEFVDEIASGKKTQTIRGTLRCKVGTELQLYTGMRTKNCRLIAKAICIDTDYCAVRPEYITFGDADKHPSADDFARADGFSDYQDMVRWFQKKYNQQSFIGHVIKWKLK